MSSKILPFLLCFAWQITQAQNLIPNPGFESFSSCPSNSCQWNLATSWNNVNGLNTCNSSTGSPDYFNVCGTNFFGTPLTLNGRVTPLGGSGMMGLSTWLSFSSNFREYLSIALSSPLQTGNAYTLTFNYTNGESDPAVAYGGASTRLGAHFSVGALAQTGAQPILLTPTYETPGTIFNTGWQTVTFFFIAADNYTHLTFGNFRNDASTTVVQVAPPSSPGFSYAYYYFDDLILAEEIVLPVSLLNFQGKKSGKAFSFFGKQRNSPVHRASRWSDRSMGSTSNLTNNCWEKRMSSSFKPWTNFR